uniref:Uncharacterized protein n=1 Tax=Nelumbo nucifera TaxID=4432 RepID=A0A822YW53_NELNU|nr:TPA_asm: hypothetical protein HUJ06_012309 [Nelumbo nucifera]
MAERIGGEKDGLKTEGKEEKRRREGWMKNRGKGGKATKKMKNRRLDQLQVAATDLVTAQPCLS